MSETGTFIQDSSAGRILHHPPRSRRTMDGEELSRHGCGHVRVSAGCGPNSDQFGTIEIPATYSGCGRPPICCSDCDSRSFHRLSFFHCGTS